MILILMPSLESCFDWWLFRIDVITKLSQKRAQAHRQDLRSSNKTYRLCRHRSTVSDRCIEGWRSSEHCWQIPNSETAVAHGAVLRALDKDDGPARITNSSYGFLRSEPFGEWPEHTGVRAHTDKLDGFRYVDNTIDWLVKKGHEVPFHAEYPITAYHIFSVKRKYFRCEEVLYVSDTCTESHYRVTHVKNKGINHLIWSHANYSHYWLTGNREGRDCG